MELTHCTSALSRNKAKLSNYFLHENFSINLQGRDFEMGHRKVIPFGIIKLLLLEENTASNKGHIGFFLRETV